MKLTHFDNRFKAGVTSVILTCDPQKKYRLITRIEDKSLIAVRGLAGVFQIQEVEKYTNQLQKKLRTLAAIKHRRPNRKEAALETLRNFRSLPDSALVDGSVVAALLDCSQFDVWRYAKDGLIPKPVTLGPRMTRWKVDELRAFLGVAQ